MDDVTLQNISDRFYALPRESVVEGQIWDVRDHGLALVKEIDRLRALLDRKPTKAQRKAARKAVEREMRSRTYDRHAYDEDVFKEGVRDIADAAIRALWEGSRT